MGRITLGERLAVVETKIEGGFRELRADIEEIKIDVKAMHNGRMSRMVLPLSSVGGGGIVVAAIATAKLLGLDI